MELQDQKDDAQAVVVDFGELSKQRDEGTVNVPDPDRSPTPQSSAPATPEAPAAPAPAPEPTAAAAPADDAAGKVHGILTPDGKTVIPYSELHNTRKSLTDTRAALDETTAKAAQLADQVRALTTQLEQRSQAAPSDPVAARAADVAASAQETGDIGAAVEAGLAQVDAEAPWLAAALREALAPIMAAARTANVTHAELAQIRQEREAALAVDQAKVQEAVDTAIANMPIVAHWQAHGAAGGTTQEAWEEAVRIDNRLRADPNWAEKPFAERFDEAQRRVIAMLGIDVVPQDLRKFVKAGSTPGNPVMEQGRAALQNAPAALGSLSDIPGGSAASASQAAEIGKGTLSISQLESMFNTAEKALAVFGRPI